MMAWPLPTFAFYNGGDQMIMLWSSLFTWTFRVHASIHVIVLFINDASTENVGEIDR